MRAISTADGRDVRVAFVGDPLRFGPWAMSSPAGGVLPRFVAPDDRAQLEAFRPDHIVVLDVDAVPASAYAGLGATVLGVAVRDRDPDRASAPTTAVPKPALRRLPRSVRPRLERRALALASRAVAVVRRRRPPLALLDAPVDQADRRLAAAIAWRATQGAEQHRPARPPWDRLVAIDPAAARGRELWRVIAPPVDDRLFAPARRPAGRPRVLVAQPSTTHRERLLTAAKHAHDVRHIAHGVTPATLPSLLRETDVAIALAPEEGGAFEHAVALHLAAGNLVITDALSPAHGLEAGIDVLATTSGRALAHAVGAARSAPGVHHAVRVRGRLKAERFRASAVWPALLADLVADLDAFG